MNKVWKEQAITALSALRRDIAYLVEGNKPLTCNDEDELCAKIKEVMAILSDTPED